ncbi:unnamed protein product [Linum trigynum]|uniref:Uncharacterized protein n=1 Tax=Linum trigynum TaxID=586398 RepID=A0AAV2DLD3_9ROSI
MLLSAFTTTACQKSSKFLFVHVVDPAIGSCLTAHIYARRHVIQANVHHLTSAVKRLPFAHFGLGLLPCNSDCKAKIQVVEQELHLRTAKDAKEKDGPTEAQPSRRRKRRQRLQEANQLSTLQKILPAVKKLLLVVILVVTLIAASYYG